MSGNDHVDRGAVKADRLGRELFAWAVFVWAALEG